MCIINKAKVKERVLARCKEANLPRVSSVSASLLSVADAVATEAINSLIDKAIAQHTRTKKTIAAPTSAGLPPTKRRS